MDQELIGKENEKVGEELEKEELMEQVSRMVAILIICRHDSPGATLTRM